MDQIFSDHLPYMIGGIIFGITLIYVPRQARWPKRLSRLVCLLTCVYPAAIVALYFGRDALGESYAYLIFGDLLAILLAFVVGVVFIAWAITWFIGLRVPADS